ncbi:Predicted O-linked N-acetylglucosamine transferase, SPINDLY family [Allochromatium warmingii]|uniref:protein O-GlcNAc transferase n=1 Tax=Allochromatium warmingii TaxID=61595 RepID=A0A1H3IU57_ALLWA|nr:tetratricopeptide repeat protein [Allochromatium warmingii]SDY31273.1 Predicted O-linked N-acetylglucosamine transferase, SPINDLY family [Allochromatium warmingii]
MINTDLTKSILEKAAAYHQSEQFKLAEKLYWSILEREKNCSEAHLNLGILALETNRFEIGLEHLKQALEIEPSNGNYWFALAQGFFIAKQNENALIVIERAKSLGFNTSEIQELLDLVKKNITSNRSNVDVAKLIPSTRKKMLFQLLRLKKFDAAQVQAYQLIEKYPDDVLGWKVLGTLLVHKNDINQAKFFLERALQINSSDAEILNSLGQVYQNLKQYDKALECYQAATLLRPDLAETWFNQGQSQQYLKQYQAAIKSYSKAILCRPKYIKAHGNLAALFLQLGQPENALDIYNKLLKISTTQEEKSDIFYSQAIALSELGRLNEALKSLDNALSIKPKFAAAITNRSNILTAQGCPEEALKGFDFALTIQPDLMVAQQNRLMCLNYISDISIERIISEHVAFGVFLEKQSKRLPNKERDINPNKRLRLGFVSGDFRQHPVIFFLLPVLEHFDKKNFEIYCYSTSHIEDIYTTKCKNLVDHWLQADTIDQHELADCIYNDSIDLLIDLSGHTSSNALAVFAAKPAPIQITWLGYPNITGLKSIDYRLVDQFTDPLKKSDVLHSERLIRLPQSFLCYRPWILLDPLPVALAPYTKNGYITFGSFNNLAKISSVTLKLWVDILLNVPNSRLKLKSSLVSEQETWTRLVKYFATHNIKNERLEIQMRTQNYQEHLEAYNEIDIALDTFPYNGTTTTCEALLMGVPVISLAGDRHASRVGASLLNQVGLFKLIANSQEEYIRIAKDLAANKTFLTQLRKELRERLEHSSLCDEVGFTQTLETTLRHMWHLWCAGKQPEPFNGDTSNFVSKKTHFCSLPQNKILKYHQTQSPSLSQQDLIINLFNQEQYDKAESTARQIIETYPKDKLAWKILGAILVKTNRFQEALTILLEANRIAPNDSVCINSLGSALHNLKRFKEALKCFRRAIEIDPNYALAYNNLGTVLGDLGKHQEALNYYSKALEISPQTPEFYCNKGLALHFLRRIEESLTAFEEALKYDPNHVDALNKRGVQLALIGRYQEAINSYDAALAIKPDMVYALNNRSNLLKDQGLLLEAYEGYTKAIYINPNLREAWHNRLFCINYRSDLSREQIFEAHCEFELKQATTIARLPEPIHVNRDPERCLRLGFVSGDFRQHSVSFFLQAVLEQLDRQQFEIFCYMTSRYSDQRTCTFQALADSWIEAGQLNMSDLANRIRSDNIDILFDLSGHTEDNALLAFAAKPAPIQISWIGYPNTTGLSAMDYRLVDDITDPFNEADTYHSESLIRLPHGFLCYRPQDAAINISVESLPCLNNDFITFGSFNTLAKVTSLTLDIWSQILLVIPNSRLLLKNPRAKDAAIWNQVIAQFAKRGISMERLELLGRVDSHIEHLQQYHRMDIALDTFPYNGTTTTCEALFMGVPVITLAGDRHAARVGKSLLTQVGLTDFIADSPEHYVQIATYWASNRCELSNLRAGLRERLEHSPLRDEVGFTRTLEKVLRQMWCLWCAGKSPQVFEVYP